jgi:hypothetical protein
MSFIDEQVKDNHRRFARRQEIEEATLAFANAVLTLAGLAVFIGAFGSQFTEMVEQAPPGGWFFYGVGLVTLSLVFVVMLFYVVPGKFGTLMITILPEKLPRNRVTFGILLATGSVAVWAVVFTVGAGASIAIKALGN